MRRKGAASAASCRLKKSTRRPERAWTSSCERKWRKRFSARCQWYAGVIAFTKPCAISNGPTEQSASKVLGPLCEITRSLPSAPSRTKKRRAVHGSSCASPASDGSFEPAMGALRGGAKPRVSLRFRWLARGAWLATGPDGTKEEIESQFHFG